MLSASSKAPPLLGELKQAHTNLLLAIDKLDRIASGRPIPEDELVEARLAVSSASLSRRLLWGRILARLAPSVRGPKEADLRLIQESDIQLLKATVNHIAAWKPSAAIANWRVYAAAEMRLLGKTIGVVALEQSMLYPLLEEMESETA